MIRRYLIPSRRSPLSWLILIVAFLILEPLRHYRSLLVPKPPHEMDEPFYKSCQEPAVHEKREKAVIVMLARNEELDDALKSIHMIEKHFNQWFHYPIMFINNQAWDSHFIETMNNTVSGDAIFEVIPKDKWGFPKDTNVDAARASMKAQEKAGVKYGGTENYHHMCRFFSGEFFLLDALKEYKYYWRVEPNVNFFCDITYDPFREMARNKKVYGWTIGMWELPDTVPSLFRLTSDYKEEHDHATSGLWKAMITAAWTPWPFRWFHSFRQNRNRNGDYWTRCHYWSNFEIADLDFFRGRAYQQYYQYLEQKGGFYRERWGDAAVHSLAVAMLVDPWKVHHFEDIGYMHDRLWQCPNNAPGGQLESSPTLGRGGTWDPEQPGGIGCRCSCPDGGARKMNIQEHCIMKMKEPNTRYRPWRPRIL